MKMSIGWGKMSPHWIDYGNIEVGACNFNDPEASRRLINGDWFPEEFMEADHAFDPDDPSRLVTFSPRLMCAACGGRCANYADGRAKVARFVPHELLELTANMYDHKIHHVSQMQSPIGVNQMIINASASTSPPPPAFGEASRGTS